MDLGETSQTDKSPLEETKPGFLVSPFLNEARHRGIKINADLVFTPAEIDSHFHLTIASGVASSKVDEFVNGSKELDPPGLSSEYFPLSGESSGQENFKEVVEKAVGEIKNGLLYKVVPSRYKEIAYPANWDFIAAFEKLHQLYPNAFVYVFGIPGIGTWMGATPELLLSIVGGRWFKSVALAGTQRVPVSGDLTQVAWTQKEIEEQALVARYIINCFKKIRLREYDEKGPKTIKAGDLAHLKTEFHVDMEDVNFPQLGSVMLDLLHPTSAVCGMPLEPSLRFLKENESYDREYFSGYLGPVNMEGATQLYVNLRCMKLMADKARLYAGAGVTEDSVPEKELEETELKMQTLLRLFY